MGLLGKILKTTIHIATTPIDIVKDVVTMGGSLIDEEPSVVKKAKKLKKDMEDIEDSLDNL